MKSFNVLDFLGRSASQRQEPGQADSSGEDGADSGDPSGAPTGG